MHRHEAAQREGDDYDVYIKLQLFISPCSRPEPDRSERTWPSLEEGERQFFIDLCEVAETNCYVWIHADQIEEVVFIPHYEDVKSLHHGVTAGMRHVYYVRHTYLFGEGIVGGVMGELTAEDHEMFGPMLEARSPISTTERWFNFRIHIQRSVFQK